MIRIDDLTLQRGSKILFQGAELAVHPGQKLALVGNNGSGKSSIFDALLGRLAPDAGSIQMPEGWRLAHMAQEMAEGDRPALAFVLDGDSALRQIQAQLEQAERDGATDQLAQLHDAFDRIDGYTATARAEQLLMGLGFSTDDFEKPVSSFSGGWRIRLRLAQTLMCPSDLLLLDEPTNHLDLDAELWLEKWLQRYEGTLILISHARDFIDHTCDGIVHIDQHTLTAYRGNYSAFEQQRAERLARQQATYRKQQQRISEIEQFVRRFKAKASKAKQAQSRVKELERMARIAPAHVDTPFDFSFPAPDKLSDPLLSLRQAELGYGQTSVLSRVNLSLHPGSRIGLLGANGAGKSTLIKSLAGTQPLLSGDRMTGEHLRIGYFSQHQMDALDLSASPALHLQRLSPKATEQSIRDFLGGFNFRGDMALAPIEPFSGGEKARLALALLVWQRPNLLLLDEPTNHLDLEMCHALTLALQTYEGAMVVVSHDRYLLKNTVDTLLLVAQGSARVYEEDLETYAQWLLKEKSKTNTAPSVTVNGSSGKKQQRQAAAEARKQLQPLTRQIQKIEHKLHALSEELAAVEAQLADPALYAAEQRQRLLDLQQSQQKLRAAHDGQEADWLDLHEQLEQAQCQMGG